MTKLFSLIALLLTLQVGAEAQLESTSDMVGYWNFDEGKGLLSQDGSVYDNDATLIGATWTNGIAGMAVELDGIDDFVEIPNASELNLNGDFTVVAWIKPYTFDLVDPIVSKGTGKRDYSYFLGTGELYGYMVNIQLQGENLGHIWMKAFRRLAPGHWYQVVGVRQGDQVAIYLNGQLARSGRYGRGPLRTNSCALRLGSHEDSELVFHGAIDEVCIFSRALSGGEIRYLYEYPSGCGCNGDQTDFVAVPSARIYH